MYDQGVLKWDKPTLSPARYLLYRVLEPLGPFIVGTWGLRANSAILRCLNNYRQEILQSLPQTLIFLFRVSQ